ncbi:MAG: hypothetical protein ABSC23_03870 [Bryobacteraceae bacterium]
MKNTLLLLLTAAVPLLAATTTVTQSVVGPDGQPSAGQALIRISVPCQAGAAHVGDRTIPVKFTAATPAGQANNFSVALIPNDASGCAGTSYSVSWTLTGGRAWTETWIVPTSLTSVSVDSVILCASCSPPTPTWLIQWQQLAQNGATLGQSPIWSGTSWVPGFTVGSAPVPSVFGRTGAVTAQTGDYTFPQIGGTAAYAQLPALSYSFNFSVSSYRDGTASVTNGSTAVTGTGTTWTSAMTGRWFIPRESGCNYMYKFTYVSATSGTLNSAYNCATNATMEYFLNDDISVTAATHQLGTADMTIQCFDNGTPRVKLDDFSYALGPSVDSTTYAVDLVFWATQAGRCVMHR